MPPLSPAPVPADETTQAPSPFSPLLSWLVAFLVVVKCVWLFAAPLRSATLPLRLAQDDFYYYLKTAENLAWHHRSTFDGITLTNGYHPLYFLLLTVVSLFVHTLPGTFRFLWVLDIASATAVFFLSRRLFSRVGSQLLANAFAVLMTALSFTLISDQMEVTLALPLGFAFLLTGFLTPAELTRSRVAVLGLLGALLALSRLDAGLLVFFYAVGILSLRSYRAVLTPGILGAFLAASLPLPLVYLWINHHFFHTLLPISGMAKELRHGHVPSILLPASFSGTNEMLVAAALGGAVVAWALRNRLADREKVLLFVVLWTPFFFYGLEMLISDWPVWNWYFYILRFAAAGLALLFLAGVSRVHKAPGGSPLLALLRSRGFAAALLLAALLKFCVAQYRVDHWMVEVEHAAGVLDSFAATHPGRYAMGDRAGMFAITTNNPVLQAEGLVMDRPYLEHIRAQEDLRSVLQRYGVDYYVAFVFTTRERSQFQQGCFQAMEPSIAGPSTLRMRSEFCETPLLQFPGFDGQYLVYRLDGK